MALTDAELRTELEKHGVNVGPVTDTTRNLYIRRLEKLRKEQKAKSATTVSTKPEKPSVKTKTRQTPKVTSRDRSKSPVLRSTRSSRNSTTSAQNAFGYSTDEDQSEKSTVVKKTSRTDHAAASSSRGSRQESGKNYATTKELETRSLTPVHRRVKALANTRKSSSHSPKRRSASLPKSVETERYSDDSDDASERSSTDSWVDMESTETNTTPSLAANRSTDDARLQKFRDEIEAWKKEEEKENRNFLTQRNLASGRRSTVLRNIDQNSSRGAVVNSRTVGNGIPTIASKIVTQVAQPKGTSSNHLPGELASDPSQKRHWTLNFSSFLPIGTCIFFMILGLLYVTMRYDSSLNPATTIGYDSEEETASETRQVLNMIYDHVAGYQGERECGTIESDKRLEVSSLLSKLSIKDKLYKTACKTFIKHQEWGVRFYDSHGTLITQPEMQFKAAFVDSQYPVLSGWCRFTRAVQKVLFRIILLTAVGILIWLGLVYRRYRLEKQREEREQMYIMVQKILDVLRRQYDTSESNNAVKPFLPILHVRDMIIPPQDRKKLARVWDRAKQFLSASETRIRVENQTIQGEDYLVWRWIQASSPAKRHTPTSRVWQGEAFDIKHGPMICPTPCLKIRNVFDPTMEVSKNWIEQIQDSILEKCQGNNGILRICVEKDSKEGLVYLLCASNHAAGRAFQALHGAWFDGRLVTVKFIRLHRFHQRFPDSVNQSRTPMRPTSDVPVSTIIAPQPANAETQQYEKLYPTLPSE